MAPSSKERLRAGGWIVLVVTIAVAIVRAETAHHAKSAWLADGATREAIFRAEAATESTARQAAAKAFLGDAWSADDDFHNQEQRQARQLAAANGVGIADALRAIDEGLRDHAAHQDPEPLIATVPPCRPRPIY